MKVKTRGKREDTMEELEQEPEGDQNLKKMRACETLNERESQREGGGGGERPGQGVVFILRSYCDHNMISVEM